MTRPLPRPNARSIFKSGAPKSAIDAAVDEVKQQGGTIKQRFDSDIMMGFAATMPTEHAAALTKASEGGAHEHM